MKLAAVCLLPLLCLAQPKDVRNSSDHPLVGRFEGAIITHYQTKEFDEAKFLTAAPGKPGNSITAAGKLTDIMYEAPAGRSSLEIFSNHQQRLAAAGFRPLYTCEKELCGNTNALLLEGINAEARNRSGFSVGFTKLPRFGAFRLEQGGRDVFVSLYVGEIALPSPGPLVVVRVLERKPMETGKVIVPNAKEITDTITRDGRIALYGIYFDTGQALLKPESKPTLDQIAEALKANPKLTLLVVGHTDNVGDFQANVALSQRRAAAVSDALQKQYAIPAARLQAFGAGMAAPVATNNDEAGRAKNRRVELVPR